MRESKDKNGPFGLVSAGSYSASAKIWKIFMHRGVFPFHYIL